MSQELYYTSAPAGLKPGSKGFCTVAMTAGMSAAVAQRLELLSGYQELYSPGDPSTENNPVAWSHWRLSIDGRTQSVLSRVCSAGMDYTRRANVFAHHVVLDATEQAAGGPAWLISQPGVMETHWTGSPRVLPNARPVPKGEESTRLCSNWASITGDSGWGGVLAETARGESPRVAYVIYAPGMDVLALLREAMALLPPRQRWLLTYSTYFTDLPAGLTCIWRCCVAGTNAAKEGRRYATSGIVIDLTKPAGIPPDSQLVQAARTGRLLISEPTPVLEPVAVAAEIPVAVERSTKRSLKAQPISEADDDGDQKWLPHSPSTIAEAANKRNDDSADFTNDKSDKFWLVAILWPLLVIPAVIAFDLVYYKRSLQDENGQLQQTIQDVRQALHVPTDADNGILRHTIDEINTNKDVLSKENETLKSDLENFRTQLQDQNKLIKDLDDRVTKFQDIATEIKTQLQDQNNSIKDITDKVSKLGDAAKDTGDKLARLTENVAQAASATAKVESSIEALNKTLQAPK